VFNTLKSDMRLCPTAQERYTLYSSTQWPNKAFTSLAAGVPSSKITIVVKRVGGGFGGKLDGSFRSRAASLIAAKKLRRPVHAFRHCQACASEAAGSDARPRPTTSAILDSTGIYLSLLSNLSIYPSLCL
jgi:CO/xanthine dehydrogenase Mo-binding subunit